MYSFGGVLSKSHTLASEMHAVLVLEYTVFIKKKPSAWGNSDSKKCTNLTRPNYLHVFGRKVFLNVTSVQIEDIKSLGK